MLTNILIIDDSETIHKVIRLAFHNLDVAIFDCHSIAQAVSMLAMSPLGQKPDIVLADASLPGDNAALAYAELKAKWKGIPFLILIGSYDLVDETAFKNAGLTNFIKKPFDSQDLLDKVVSSLGRALTPKNTRTSGQLELEPRRMSPLNAGSHQMPPPVPKPDIEKMDRTSKPETFAAQGHPLPPPPVIATDSEGSYRPKPVPPPPKPVLTSEMPDDDISFELMHRSQEFKSNPATHTGIVPPPPKASRHQSSSRQSFLSEKSDFEDTYAHTPSEDAQMEDEISTGFMARQGLSTEDTGALASSLLSTALKEELKDMVKSAVYDYCDQHFKALAKEVITEEIRKLTDLKARLLIDN